MGAVALDADVVIGAVWKGDAHHDNAVALLRERAEDRVLMPASVYAEVLVGPLRRREEQHIDAFMDRGAIRVIAADRQIARRAAQLRARHSALRLADALALATALEHEAELLTFDRRLRTIQEEHS